MTRHLKLSPDLKLPLEAAGQTTAILGLRGSGKTYTAGVLAEELLDANVPIVVIDPTDAWWGLRSHYPVVIFGGERGDIKLDETDGKIVAEWLVEEQVPVILSLSHMRKAPQRRFVTDFLTELYALKAPSEKRWPLTVFIDEAPLFIPQRVMGEDARTVGAVEDLVARGRIRGFGVVLVSQRSATLNKDVLSQANTMLVHRLTGIHDRKVLAEWMDAHADAGVLKEKWAELATLGAGDCWSWAPELGIYQRAHIREKRSFDSSASPGMGKRLKPPRDLQKIDLDTIKGRLAETIARRKADDPAALKKRIAELEKQLAAKPTAPGKPKIIKERIGFVPAQVAEGVARQALAMAKAGEELIEQSKHVWKQAERLRKWPEQSTIHDLSAAKSVPHKMVNAITAAPTPSRGNPGRAASMNGDGLAPRLLEILQVLSASPTGYSAVQLATLVGMKHSGGGYANYLGALNSKGLIVRERGHVTISQAGLDLLGGPVQSPPTPEEVRALWQKSLGPAIYRVLETIIHAGEEGITKEAVAESVGMVSTGGGFANYIGKLNSNALIEKRGGLLVASDMLRG